MQMKESTKCSRLSQQLDRAITTVFKPVANHSFNVRSRGEEIRSMPYPPVSRMPWSYNSDVPSDFQIVYEKKKKSDGKMVRAERQVVLDMLFSAFEKHQYYNIKELVDITKQPVVRSMHTQTHTSMNADQNYTCPPCPVKCEQLAYRLTIAPSFVAEKIVPAWLRAHTDMMNQYSRADFVPARGEERCVGADETLRSSSPSDYI